MLEMLLGRGDRDDTALKLPALHSLTKLTARMLVQKQRAPRNPNGLLIATSPIFPNHPLGKMAILRTVRILHKM
jgi:hypothetical protein